LVFKVLGFDVCFVATFFSIVLVVGVIFCELISLSFVHYWNVILPTFSAPLFEDFVFIHIKMKATQTMRLLLLEFE
jgi:hypothetical protein